MRSLRSILAFRTGLLLALVTSTWVVCGSVQGQTFTYREPFGVAHRNEVLEFDLAQPVDAGDCRLLDDKEREVPCQIARNGKKLLLRTNLGRQRDIDLATGRGKAARAGRSPW